MLRAGISQSPMLSMRQRHTSLISRASIAVKFLLSRAAHPGMFATPGGMLQMFFLKAPVAFLFCVAALEAPFALVAIKAPLSEKAEGDAEPVCSHQEPQILGPESPRLSPRHRPSRPGGAFAQTEGRPPRRAPGTAGTHYAQQQHMLGAYCQCCTSSMPTGSRPCCS